MAEQVQERINVRMRNLDDVFHNMIIALERLESFLIIKSKSDASKVKQTAVKSARDLHDDAKNPPNEESVFGEVQLQCSTLWFQTQMDDPKLFKKSMEFFFSDLLEWYGGREQLPYDEVEMFVLPIITALSHQAESVIDIMATTDKYVKKLRRMEDLSEKEKERAVEEGFNAYIRGQHYAGEQLQKFIESGAEVVLTSRKRGTAIDGYKRLIDAMIKLYDDAMPAKIVRKTVETYLPAIVEQTPDITDVAIEQASKNKVEGNPSDGGNKSTDKNDDVSKNRGNDAPVDKQKGTPSDKEGDKPVDDDKEADTSDKDGFLNKIKDRVIDTAKNILGLSDNNN